jgi:hypothetical protein
MKNAIVCRRSYYHCLIVVLSGNKFVALCLSEAGEYFIDIINSSFCEFFIMATKVLIRVFCQLNIFLISCYIISAR